MLLVQQFRDNQLAEDQFDAMKRALRAAGNPAETETIGFDNAGYYEGYFVPQMRADVYRTLLAFLKKEIGN